MTLLQAIDTRVSRRSYTAKPLVTSQINKLQELLDEYNSIQGLNMQLVLDNGEAFKGLRRSYGMFSGVKSYIGLIDRLTDDTGSGKYTASENTEKMGYYGELLVLEATALGLGTCWVGGTFDRKFCPFKLREGEMVACTITLGNVSDDMSGKEKFLRRMTHRKTKAIEEMFRSDGDAPEWFMAGMTAVEKAPSAVNRQPVVFSYRSGMVTASVENPKDVGSAFDLGIAKLHFRLGSGGGSWEFGNGGRFTRTE